MQVNFQAYQNRWEMGSRVQPRARSPWVIFKPFDLIKVLTNIHLSGKSSSVFFHLEILQVILGEVGWH